jgi:hypothetical protein
MTVQTINALGIFEEDRVRDHVVRECARRSIDLDKILNQL